MKFNGRNIHIGANVQIGANVRIGDNTTIYDNVVISDDVTICNDCVIGEPTHSYYRDKSYFNPPTTIGAGSLIRSHTIIYSGSTLGRSFSSGHRVTIREHTVFGDNCRVGTLSDIQGHVVFGESVWLHSNVHICSGSVVEDFVFMYPYTVLTNDPHPPSEELSAPVVMRFAQLGVNTLVLPGVVIGRHSLTGAGSVVTRDVQEYSLVVGNPARKLKDVREITSETGSEALYPWPYRFDRGMPWQGVPFERWMSNQHGDLTLD